MSNSFSPDRIRDTITLLWVFAILNTVFRDIHEMAKAETVREILGGTLNGNPVTEPVLLAGAVAVEVFLLAPLLTHLLSARWARQVNLALAPLAVLGGFLAPPNDPDDYFFAAVTSASFIAIFWMAWRWDVRQAAWEMRRVA